jgi:hypothetical protein
MRLERKLGLYYGKTKACKNVKNKLIAKGEGIYKDLNLRGSVRILTLEDLGDIV